jgi:hypothetical protein
VRHYRAPSRTKEAVAARFLLCELKKPGMNPFSIFPDKLGLLELMKALSVP